MNTNGFWRFLMTGAVGMWLISILMGIFLFSEVQMMSWSIFIGLVVLHGAEIPIGVKIGKEKGLNTLAAAMKTFAFGFTWWVPMKKGIFTR